MKELLQGIGQGKDILLGSPDHEYQDQRKNIQTENILCFMPNVSEESAASGRNLWDLAVPLSSFGKEAAFMASLMVKYPAAFPNFVPHKKSSEKGLY